MNGLNIGGRLATDPTLLRQIAADWRQPVAREPVVVPGSTAFPTQGAAVTQLKAWLDEAFCLDGEIEDAERRRLGLAEKLIDPSLLDHPKRGDAEQRYEELIREAGQARTRLEAVLWLMAKTWAALGEGRSDLIAEGWPTYGTATSVRIWLEGCLLARWKPGPEVPF